MATPRCLPEGDRGFRFRRKGRRCPRRSSPPEGPSRGSALTLVAALLGGIMQRLPFWEEEEEEEEDVKERIAAYVRHWERERRGERCPYLNQEPCWYCVINSAGYETWEDSSEDAEESSDNDDVPHNRYTTFCGFRRAFLCPPSASLPPRSSNLDVAVLGLALPQKQQLTAEEAERNAELLVAEEERLKKKAEKRRMKKKRQKDRKRQERRGLELKAKSEAVSESPGSGQNEGTLALDGGPPDSQESFSEASPGRSPSRHLVEEEEEEEEAEEELDFSSTFVSKARRKVDAQSLLPRKERGGKKPPERKADTKQKAEKPELQLTSVEQSMVLADCGNETAKQERYHEAVLLFTEAIKLNPQEYRFFGNRSFCYERLQSHTEALRDAQHALSLQPGWPRGLFRQGKALLGLKRYPDAARMFQQLLQFDGFRGDAAIQLQKCRIQHLLESRLGCSRHDRDVLPAEAQLPLSGKQPARQWCPDSSAQAIATTRLAPPAAKAPVREWFAVWVGNLAPRITQQVLLRYFQPFGPIDSIRCLPHKSCAFVNYSRKEAAEAAYAALQGAEVEGCKLLLQLKHPAHATAAPSKAAPRHCLSSWA
ncbi:tetratricopeptide repeat protein 31 [Protobothrops mucrosquamatus]|uniref:tetratricopeptide repeat protein 31 n=1 Tax=Protobothrops mucrosquamatus TaxID=103944 RepID=UPI0010FAD386|nr:tetratricopeptide repeat protein 31 [Protobothrops mucrosquamatus]